MDKKTFMVEVQRRIGTDFPVPPEDCTKAVFQMLHERIEPGQAGHIKTHLPQDLKKDWELGMTERAKRIVTGDVEKRDRDEFLQAVRERAGMRSTEEASRATTAVFSVLKQALPEKDVQDTASELPGDLRGLWTEASI